MNTRIPFKFKSDKYFDWKSIPGDTLHEVEIEENSQFGLSNKKIMKFKDFLKSENVYLSTQYGLSNGSIVAPPLDSISELLDYDIEQAGNRVCLSINAWIGSGKKLKSSGLHHDFHDNFLFVLEGKKKIILYSFVDAKYMYLNGTIRTIYPNGLICYNDEREKNPTNEVYNSSDRVIRQDGAYRKDVLLWKMSKCEDDNQLDLLEEEYLKILCLDPDDDQDDDKDKEIKTGRNGAKLNPPSFSKIPSHVLHNKKELDEQYPLFKNAKSRMEFVLFPGDAIFIPCGWFHEVQSCATDNNHHVAINYWYAPPENIDDVLNPYVDDMWKDYVRQLQSS